MCRIPLSGTEKTGEGGLLTAHWAVVQLVARLTLDQKVPGSSPGGPVVSRCQIRAYDKRPGVDDVA